MIEYANFNNEPTIAVRFGYGTISIGAIGCSIEGTTNKMAGIVLNQVFGDPISIGEEVPKEKVSEAPDILLTFSSAESVNVLIAALERSKKVLEEPLQTV